MVRSVRTARLVLAGLVACVTVAACGNSVEINVPDVSLTTTSTTSLFGDEPEGSTTTTTEAGPSSSSTSSSTTTTSTTTTVPTTSTAVSDPTTTIAASGPVSDDFAGSSLGNHWTLRRGDAVEVVVDGGALEITMVETAPWFGPAAGVLLYQEVTGDIGIVASIRARRASDPALAPDRPVHLGGLMVRDPASDADGENHALAAVGRGEAALRVQWTSTAADRSVSGGSAWPSGDAQLRVCRTGAVIDLAQRPLAGGDWEPLQRLERADLPETLQAGIVAFTAGTPDLVVVVDDIDFDTPEAHGCP